MLWHSFRKMVQDLQRTTVSRDLLQKEIEERNLAEKLIAKQHVELEARNASLSTLFKISTMLGRTIDLQELMTEVLKTVTSLPMLNIESKGGIFVVEGDTMKLVSHLGHAEEFLDAHIDMKVGTCLCGIAAVTGELCISHNSHDDSRHSINYPGMHQHGHIIVPLKAMHKVVGVLYLYMPTDVDLSENMLEVLESAGNQIGIAINNAMLYEKTKSLSLHDPLTGLANRNLMNIELERNFIKSRRDAVPFSVLMMDLDYFKKYNDTYGHDAGDKLLVEFANILIRQCRKTDLVARYGGEEFIIILPETNKNNAYEVSERIRIAVQNNTRITVSIGVVCYYKDLGEKEDIIREADAVLYQAKNRGRNRVEVGEQQA
jgi:two-component system cell cycle response regulator